MASRTRFPHRMAQDALALAVVTIAARHPLVGFSILGLPVGLAMNLRRTRRPTNAQDVTAARRNLSPASAER